MASLADLMRADLVGFTFTDSTGRTADGNFGPWTQSGSLTDPMNIRNGVFVLRSTGTITTATILLQASTDNTTYFPVQNIRLDTGVTGANLNYAGGGTIAIAPLTTNAPARFMRVNMASLTGGGTVFVDVLMSGD